MKKGFLAGLFFIFMIPVFPAAIPDSLYGLWEGKDRYVFFEEQASEQKPYLVIVLKEYYGWYLDRAAEPDSYSQRQSRSRNAATPKKAEQVQLDFQSISYAEDLFLQGENASSGFACEMLLDFSKYQKSRIAIAVVDDSLYLNFFVQDSENPAFYRGNAGTDGIKLSMPYTDTNIGGLYISENRIFNVRYWITDMDYSGEKASLTYDNQTYFVDKHLFSCGNNYSATSGRSNVIRNVVAPEVFEESSFIWSDDKRLLVTDSEPYLVRLADKKTFESLMQIVSEANSRIKPPAEPPFPPSDLDWHWDLIDSLEKGNVIIQQVRERQDAFGARGKDSGR